MELLIFILITAFIFLGIVTWGCVVLPKEKWQMVAAFPKTKFDDKSWSATPITYYGFFSALAYTLAATLYIILSLAILSDYKTMLIIGLPILFLCIPASKIIAMVVEKKKYTFTIGGASFFGFIIAPLWVWILQKFHFTQADFSLLGSLSPIIIAYAFGEGLGRLACISFGCCYGKPVDELKYPFNKIFKNFNYKYIGKTKKACYESCLENRATIPIQGITAFLYIITGLISIFFFFKGYYKISFILPLIVTQAWRAYSETLRCDFRGEHTKLSTYQIMALSTIPYGLLLTFISSTGIKSPDLMGGLIGFWNINSILFLEFLFIFSFWFTGRSNVTLAHVNFFVCEDKI